MSKAAYWQRGEAIDFTNNTGAAIEANEIVVFGSHVGVAGAPIAKGETGSLHVNGVFEMPKKEQEEIAAGVDVYYSAAGITATAEGNTKAGYAIQAAGATDETVKVKLLG